MTSTSELERIAIMAPSPFCSNSLVNQGLKSKRRAENGLLLPSTLTQTFLADLTAAHWNFGHLRY